MSSGIFDQEKEGRLDGYLHGGERGKAILMFDEAFQTQFRETIPKECRIFVVPLPPFLQVSDQWERKDAEAGRKQGERGKERRRRMYLQTLFCDDPQGFMEGVVHANGGSVMVSTSSCPFLLPI